MPGAGGMPWLSMPRTNVLLDPEEYAATTILPRRERKRERAIWGLAFAKKQKGGRAGKNGLPADQVDAAVALLAGYGIHAWPAGRVAPATGRPGAVELVGQHPGW